MLKELPLNGNQMPQKNCTDGSYRKDGRCCKLCEAGMYKEKECDQTTPETQCKQCERDHYTAAKNLMGQCRVCKTCNINNKLKTLRECTAQKDTVCECVPGYYCSDSNCEHCRQVTICSEGHGVTTQASRTNDTICSPCERGTFSNVSDHHSPCRPHTRCEDIGKELKTPGTETTDAVCGVKTSCSWMLPAGLWAGLVLTSALVFAVALFCWRSKRRGLYSGVNLSLPEAPVDVFPEEDELNLPLPSKDLNALYKEEKYTPSYSCDVSVYASDEKQISCDCLDLEDSSVPITPLKVSVSFLESPNLNESFSTGKYQRTISEPQEDEWCDT